MEFKKINLVCFSPTRTTKTILQEVSKGLAPESEDDLDLTFLKDPDDLYSR